MKDQRTTQELKFYPFYGTYFPKIKRAHQQPLQRIG